MRFEAVKQRPPHSKGSPSKLVVEIDVSQEVNKGSVACAIYLLYKSNFLTRHVLTKMLEILSNEKLKLEEICRYLVEEAVKA